MLVEVCTRAVLVASLALTAPLTQCTASPDFVLSSDGRYEANFVPAEAEPFHGFEGARPAAELVQVLATQGVHVIHVHAQGVDRGYFITRAQPATWIAPTR